MIIQKPGEINKIETRIDEAEGIPQVLKRKYKKIELDPLCIILTYLPIHITAEELRVFFNTLLSSLVPRYDEDDVLPVADCEIGETKRFAVLWLVDLEAVWKVISMDTVILKDTKVKISRPKGFFSKHFEGARYEFNENGVLQNLEAGEEIRLYLGNLPQYISDADVKKMLESIGPLKAFEMKTDFSMGESVSKGYCLFEYYDSRHAETALKSLNNQEIGDKRLRVQRVAAPEPEKKEGIKKAQTKEADTCYLLMFPKLRDPLVQATLSVPAICATPSRVVQLLNMCSAEDLFDQDFVRDLTKDVKDECSKFGNIETIEIPTPDSKTGKCGPSVGKVFVKFLYQISAKQARYRLNGRIYARRTVIASFFPENRFEKKEYLSAL
jgi:splicing factor U2AF subunit